MNFLDAKRLVDGFAGGEELSFLLAVSGNAEPFDLYLRAAAARHGRAAKVRLLPFNTLSQRLRGTIEPGALEVFLLMPWDFVPEADWRSGIAGRVDENALRDRATEIKELLSRRAARVVFLPAPMPPLLGSSERDTALEVWIQSQAAELGASLLPAEAFSLSGYLASGCPVGGAWIGRAAVSVVDAALSRRPEPKKVLVTDLDNVMWSGGIAEEGVDGVAFEPTGKGYPHFVYQTLLKRLCGEGTLLAAVSRNDAEVALAPFRTKRMTLAEDDFVAIVASYHAKSAQISELATQLNLGLDSFVFVDDNAVELTEVSLALPAVRCVPFPQQSDKLAPFFTELASLFSRREVTAEDRERTAMYRRRLQGMVPSAASGADLTRFLEELEMTLTFHDRSSGDRTRVVQLINKTNQFNLNGRRVTDTEVSSMLDAGGRLYGASLADRTGSHGEILACLVGPDSVIASLVMSCRVFQRRVEYAFLAWLTAQPNPPVGMSWASTPRNEPFVQFLQDVTGSPANGEGLVRFEPEAVQSRFSPDLRFFATTEN
jgi:FkbH-like protein